MSHAATAGGYARKPTAGKGSGACDCLCAELNKRRQRIKAISKIWIGLTLLPASAFAQPFAVASAPSDGGYIVRLCLTRADCRVKTDKRLANPVPGATSAVAFNQDNFYWIGRINMASKVEAPC